MNKKLAECGFHGWPEHEVLEVLLYDIIPRRDTNSIAHALIKECGSLCGVLNASEEKLERVNNVGPATSAYLRKIREFIRYYAEIRMKSEKFDIESKITRDFIHELFAEEKREIVYVICLDQGDNILLHKLIMEGGFDNVDLNVNLIAKTAVECSASKIILAHNHPSGSVIASSADITATNHLAKVISILGIKLTDHLVVTKDCISSIVNNIMFTEHDG